MQKNTIAIAYFMFLLCSLIFAGRAVALEVPGFHGYVNDFADMMSPASEQRLTQALQAFDMSDSTQVAILTINSLEGDSLEDFSIRTVDKWKIGQRNKDNGVLLLVAKKEREVRIEVGRGLEGVMTDLVAGRIIDQVITPRFKKGMFEEGFDAGVAAIIQASRGEFQAERQVHSNAQRRGGESPFFSYLIMAGFFVAFLGRASRVLGAIVGALLLPFIVLFGLSFPFSLLLLLVLMPIGGLAGFLLPLFLASSMSRRGGMYYGGGFSGGGGGSFGGFGGGGFGGGGASGRW